MIYALFAMLIFMVLTSLAYNSAKANYERYLSEVEEDEISETVYEATELFMDMIISDKVTCHQDITNMSSASPTYGEITDWEYHDNGKQMPHSNEYHFSDVVLNMVKSCYNYNRTTSGTFVINYHDKGNVLVYMTMSDYDITLLFASSNSDHPNYVTVRIPTVKDIGSSQKMLLQEIENVEYDNQGNSISHCIYKVEWEKGNVSVLSGNQTGVNIYEKFN